MCEIIKESKIPYMTYEEFKKKDVFGAFDEFMPISRAKEEGLIPKEFRDGFKDKCICDSDMIIKCSKDIPESEWFTKVMCCNPRCYYKVGLTLERIIKSFGGVNIAGETCIKLAKTFLSKNRLKYKSAVEILMLPPADVCMYLDSRKANSYIELLQKMRGMEMSYPELVASVGIPLLDDSCDKIFRGINSFNDLIKAKEKYGSLTQFLQVSGVYDKKKLFFLHEYLADMYLLEVMLSKCVRPQGLKRISICITGAVSFCNLTRKDYVNVLNKYSRGKHGDQYFEFIDGSCLESSSYIVADSPSNSRKYLAGVRRNVLIGSEDLLAKVLDEVENLDKEIYGEVIVSDS